MPRRAADARPSRTPSHRPTRRAHATAATEYGARTARYESPRPRRARGRASIAGGKCPFQIHVEREQRDEEEQHADQPRARQAPAAECPPPREADRGGEQTESDARDEALRLPREAFRERGLRGARGRRRLRW